jgi:hypothetical protein
MYLLPTAVNFREPEDIARLVATIEGIGQKFSLVIVDTVARAIAGAEENSSTDMGLFVAACDEIKALTGGALLAVHHAGKDSSRGARGSTALLGAVDTSLMVGKSDDIVVLRTEKMKDAEPMDEINLIMQTVPASISETSVVLERTDEPAPRRQKAAGWRDNPQAYHAFQALQNLLIDKGVTRIHVTEWHEAHTQKEPDLSKQQRQRARQMLLDAGPVVCDKKIVWINKELT